MREQRPICPLPQARSPQASPCPPPGCALLSWLLELSSNLWYLLVFRHATPISSSVFLQPSYPGELILPDYTCKALVFKPFPSGGSMWVPRVERMQATLWASMNTQGRIRGESGEAPMVLGRSQLQVPRGVAFE